MTELGNDSTDRSHDAAAYAASLMHHYGFDLGGSPSNNDAIAQLLLTWQEQYPAAWIRLATIEALYQGRYKAISVEQILVLWQRRSQPVYHFNYEFERLICDRLPQPLAPPAASMQAEPFSLRSAQAMVAHRPYHAVPLPHSHPKANTPYHSDAMQALRTLQEATAAPTLADRVPEPMVAPNEPSLAPAYSYILRSDRVRSHDGRSDEPSQPLTQEQGERLVQSDVNPGEPSGLLPLDLAVSVLAVNDETVQAESIAPSETRLDLEQPSHTDQTAATSLPAQVPSTAPQAASIARILQQLDDQELAAKTMFPGVGLLAQTLQPKLTLDLTARYQPVWLTDTSSKEPIHQFTPTPEASNFHTKLKSVAQVPEEEVPGEEPCDPTPQGG